MSINRVNISGHLTRDPEFRMTPKGTQVLSFGIAVNDRRLNRETNQWEDYPNFVECTMFGTRAEAVGRIVRKGMKVSIDGKLRFSPAATMCSSARSAADPFSWTASTIVSRKYIEDQKEA